MATVLSTRIFAAWSSGFSWTMWESPWELRRNPRSRSNRCNYLFAGSDAGGERAANIYSLLGTAMLNAMDPYLYLRHVLERIAEHPINRIEELLPWNVERELPAARQQ